MIYSIAKWLVFKVLYPIVYRVSAKRPVVSDKYILVENHMEQLSDNYHILYKKMQENGYNIRIHYLKVYKGHWFDIVRRSIRLIWDMGNAYCVCLAESNSLFGSFTLRKETQLIQMWHACGAFKKWGRSVADKFFGEDEKNLSLYNGHKNYTLVPVSGEGVCWAYEEAFGLQGKCVVKPLGVSRTDWYYDPEAKGAATQKIDALFPKRNHRRILLYAPTFRGEIKTAAYPDCMDYERLYELFHQDYIILVKNHPFVKEKLKVKAFMEEFVMDVSDRMDIKELLMAADCLITDYSSVIFEYSLLNRPMIFFAYDLEAYYDERGFYYPYEEFVPGPVVKDMEQLIAQLRDLKTIKTEEIIEFKEKYMDGCDGHATKRLLDYIHEYHAV